MLTKLGSTLGLQSAGRVLLGGGNGSDGLPLGPYANWAALPASGEDGALASVTSLGAGNAYGIAVYDGGASEWALYMAWFDTFADMTAFAEPISTGALASVEASASNDENGVRYQYDGAAWARTAALTAGFAWALTQSQALTGADPTGIGLVRDGDLGVVALAAGPVTRRFKAACTVAAGAGGGTRPAWIPPAAYASTPTIRTYFVGTESNAALVAQGVPTITQTAPGTVGATGGYIRLDAPAGAGTSVAQLTLPALTGADKFEISCEVRGAITANGIIGFFQLASEAATQCSIGLLAILAATVQPLQSNGSAWNRAIADTLTLRGGGSAFPASTPWLWMCQSGEAITDNVSTCVDGALYCSLRRNFDAAGTGTTMTQIPLAVGGTAGASGRFELRNFTYLSWT
jgi:hypothetical protein